RRSSDLGRCGTPALRIRSPMAAAPRTQKAGHARACRLLAKRRGSVQALALGDVARTAARLALHRGGGLALALLGRLLVELALAGFGEDAGLLAGALEPAQRKLEGFVFADFDGWHGISGRWIAGGPPGEPRMIAGTFAGTQTSGIWGTGGWNQSPQIPAPSPRLQSPAPRSQIHPMKVLGIETSCDETGVAVYDTALPGAAGLRAHAVYSQVALHAGYGGVVPELASRDHVRKLLPLVRQTLSGAGLGVGDLDGGVYTP